MVIMYKDRTYGGRVYYKSYPEKVGDTWFIASVDTNTGDIRIDSEHGERIYDVYFHHAKIQLRKLYEQDEYPEKTGQCWY